MEILYEDNHLIILNKCPGEIVQGDKTGDVPLSEKLKQFLKDKYGKPGNVFVGVAHRLDRPVSGVVIFAKTSKALARLNEMLRNREIEKTYWAVVSGDPPPEGHLIHYLRKNQEKNISRAYEKEVQGSLRAELKFHRVTSSDHYHLLEVNLMTGRHHQIRAQLSAAGFPIKGDVKYGARRANEDRSIHLHSRKTVFLHPVKREMLEITAPPPADALWQALQGISK
ncbi:MAG: RluA family pseudouridine synthase [Bacteroidia bacterium]|nr:RluA family pseudouridine synthase [Bacteroidia bacterium]